MATYKVLQDIEAEDKLVGPLTLRQFLYAITCIVCLYICFLLVTKHVAYLAAIFLPPALVFGFFAFPWGREQPTEIWALAKVRFMLKPRRRIWNQSGIKELVTVTAPKRVEMVYTNGLSETEVTSRLRALADTLDSHGWAIKNVDVTHLQSALSGAATADSDRLLGVSLAPQSQPQDDMDDIQPAEDMLDEQHNPIARQFDQMIKRSNAKHRERIKQEMTNADVNPPLPVPKAIVNPKPASPPNDYWFMGQAPTTGPTQVITPNEPASAVPAAIAAAEPTADEEALARRLKQQNKDSAQTAYGHMRTIQPLSGQSPASQSATQSSTSADDDGDIAQAKQKTTSATVTPRPNPGTLKYVNNNDLTVATIARQVNQNPPDEIVISLH